MGYSADKSPLIGHLAGPIRRLEPLGAQRQEKCGPNRPTPTGYSCNNAEAKRLVDEALAPAGPAQPGWTCPSCKEVNEGQFGQCWNCGANCPEGPDA